MSSAEAENTPLLQGCDIQVNPRFVNEQFAVLTYTGTLAAKTWRTYLQKNWENFKGGLDEVKLLIICGVHGGGDGSIGDAERNVEDCKLQTVSLLTYRLSRHIPGTFPGLLLGHG